MSKKEIYNAPPAEGCNPSYDTLLQKSKPQPVTLEWAVEQLRCHEGLKEITAKARELRAAGDTAGYRHCKALAGALIPAVQLVGGRRTEHIVGLTGISMVDLDHVAPERLAEVRRLIEADPHTLLCHLTASGEGFRILFRYTVPDGKPFAYFDAWHTGNEHYRLLTGCDYDTQTKNANRLSYLCHDPDACHHPQAHPFPIASKAQQTAAAKRDSLTARKLEQAWEQSVAAGHCWIEGHRHDMMIDLARRYRSMGLSQQQALDALLARLDPDQQAQEAEGVARWVFESSKFQVPSHLASLDDGSALQPQEQALGQSASIRSKSGSAGGARYFEIGEWLQQHYRLRQNEVRRTYEYFDETEQRFLPMSESLRNSMMIECDTELGKRVRRADFDAVLESDWVPRYNPFREYLESLPPYDGYTEPDYIGELCATVHTTSPAGFFHKYFEKWFVGLLPAMLEHDKTNQCVLIFTGPQGTYKSTFFRELLPPGLRDYFLLKTDPLRMDKDARLALSEFALICLEELGTMTPRELDTIKGIITQTVISERAPYQHSKESRPHIASFCGTSNEKELFGDRTGLRRWLAFEIQSIDPPQFNHDGIYRQAYYLWQHGFQYWFDPQDVADLAEHMEQFKEVDLEREQISRYYRVPSEERDSEGRYYDLHTFVTTAEILERCSAGALRGQLSKSGIGRTMKAMGFRSHSNGQVRGYYVYEIGCQEWMDRRTRRTAEDADRE